MSETKTKQSTHIDILTDFGFKWFFGREENKINLINLLNSLLEGERIVVDLAYSNIEEDGEAPTDRRVLFDLRCTGVNDEVFLVEIQLQNNNFFFDRAVTYTSRTISRLAKKGKEGEDYELPPVYFIAILDFRIDATNKEKCYYSGKIIDEFDQEILYPKLSFKMLVLPNFKKSRTNLLTIQDQWMYLLKHSHEMKHLSNYLDKRIFSRIFEIGELANLKPKEKMSYISSLEQKRFYNSTIAYAKEEGREEGRKEAKTKAKSEKLALARKMLVKGYNKKEVCELLDFSLEEIEKL